MTGLNVIGFFGRAETTTINQIGFISQADPSKRPVPQRGPVSGLLEGFSVRFRPVTEGAVRQVGVEAAAAFYGERLPPFLQLVCPDRAGRFPGEPDVNPALLQQQPLLALRTLSRLSRLLGQPPVRLRHRPVMPGAGR